jgi:hypothetical protein
VQLLIQEMSQLLISYLWTQAKLTCQLVGRKSINCCMVRPQISSYLLPLEIGQNPHPHFTTCFGVLHRKITADNFPQLSNRVPTSMDGNIARSGHNKPWSRRMSCGQTITQLMLMFVDAYG